MNPYFRKALHLSIPRYMIFKNIKDIIINYYLLQFNPGNVKLCTDEIIFLKHLLFYVPSPSDQKQYYIKNNKLYNTKIYQFS